MQARRKQIKSEGAKFLNCKVKVPFFFKFKSESNPPPKKKKRHTKAVLILPMFGSFNTIELRFCSVRGGGGVSKFAYQNQHCNLYGSEGGLGSSPRKFLNDYMQNRAFLDYLEINSDT